MIENPHGEKNIIKDKAVTNRKKLAEQSGRKKLNPEDITQVQPQKLSLTLRSGRNYF